MPQCEHTFEDTTCPEYDGETTLQCTGEATQVAVLQMPGEDGWDTFEAFACDKPGHANPLVADSFMRVLRQWGPIR